MNVDIVRSGDVMLCCVLRGGLWPGSSTFITPDESALQVGHIVHPRGHEIARHSHRPVVRQVTGMTEVLLVQRGRCQVDVYDDQRRLVTTRDLGVGDIVVLYGGGHGFRMLEDTVFLEIKQGPYLGPAEKETF